MKNTVTKKFQFGAGLGATSYSNHEKEQIENYDLAIQQMRSRNALWNSLVALDKVTRVEYYDIVNKDNTANATAS